MGQTAALCLLRRPAIVHVHAASGASFMRKSLVLALGRACGAQTVFHLHGGGFAQFATVRAGPLLRRWIRHTLEASNCVIALSPAWAAFVRDVAPRAQVEVVPNAVPLPLPEIAAAAAEEPGTKTAAGSAASDAARTAASTVASTVASDAASTVASDTASTAASDTASTAASDTASTAASDTASEPDAHRILFLGRVEPAKGVGELLAACALLAPRYPRLCLVLAGEGDLDWARRRAGALGIGWQVEVPGWLDPHARAGQLARATLFCLPSWAEGVPMAMLEAMAAWRPVVVSAVGGMLDVIRDGVDGVLVPPRDVAALAAGLDRVLADRVLRARLAQAARARIEQDYSTDKVARRLAAIYARLTHDEAELGMKEMQ